MIMKVGLKPNWRGTKKLQCYCEDFPNKILEGKLGKHCKQQGYKSLMHACPSTPEPRSCDDTHIHQPAQRGENT